MTSDPRTIRALLIDVDPRRALLLREMLGETLASQLHVEQASGLTEGLERLATGEIDVILLAFPPARRDSLRDLEALQTASATVPIVILSDASGEELAVRAVVQGAQDYLIDEMVNGPRLLRTCRAAIERKRAAEALRLSEARFRSTFESAAVGMAIGDVEGRLAQTNSSFQRMLGYTRDELQQMIFTEITHPDDVDADVALFKELIAGKRHRYGLEKRYIRKDGLVVWGRLNVSLVRDAEGKPQFGIAMVEDITERKTTEEALRRSEEKLRASQKLEAVGRLAGGIAHDFNNLLTAILGYSDLVLQELDTDSPLRRDIEDIKKNGQRAASLTQQLLAFGRSQVLRPETLDLNDILANMSTVLRPVIGSHIELILLPCKDLGSVEADRSQIEQLVLNLAFNARDAMPEGGKLTIETANVEIDEAYFRSGVEVKPGAYSVIAVSDTGCGMDKETQARAFEPFFTTKEKGSGAGLGLSTAYGIAKQSGGYIWLYSEPKMGTTVKVYLPCSEETSEKSESEGHGASRVTRAAETILLVEDEESVRTLATRLLKAKGYTVLQANNGREGLRICEEHPERIDLILTDLVMPELGGPQMVERLPPARRGAKVLYMSGYTEAAIFNRALEPGKPFLHKPFTAKDLTEKVRQVLDAPEEGNGP